MENEACFFEQEKTKNLVNVKAEIYAVSSILQDLSLDKERAGRIIDEALRRGVTADSFGDNACRLIMELVIGRYRKGEPVDSFIVMDELEKMNRLEAIGGGQKVEEIFNKSETSAHAEHYLMIVDTLARRRRLVQACKRITEKANDLQNVTCIPMLIAEAERALLAVDPPSRNTADWASEVKRIGNDLREKVLSGRMWDEGASTGFGSLDEITGGLKPTEMTIIAARPSVGKTSLAMNIAMNVATPEFPVCLFSLEMTYESIVQREFYSRLSHTKGTLMGGSLLRGQREATAAELDKIMAELEQKHLFVIDRPGLDILELRSLARRKVLRNKVKLIIIDYLQLITLSDANSRYMGQNEMLTQISASVKEMARELNLPVIALSQLNRANAGAQTKVPDGFEEVKLTDLRGSGAIEQDADVVILLHKTKEPNGTAPTSQSGTAPEDPIVKVKVNVAKNRNGKTGSVIFDFDRAHTRFIDPNM